MGPGGFKRFCFSALFVVTIVAWVVASTLAVVKALVVAGAIPESGHWRGILVQVASGAWLSVVLAPAIPVLLFLRTHLCSPRGWKDIHALLTDFRDQVFHDCGGQDNHHRVTLFKFRKTRWQRWKWPWGGWLISVERSGHTTRGSVVVFAAPDNAEEVEGVAGAAWVQRGQVERENLATPVHGTLSYSEDLAEYAKQTFLTSDRAKEMATDARSFHGMMIRVKGRPWGVVVIDSRRDKIKKKGQQPLFDLFVATLSRLIERA